MPRPDWWDPRAEDDAILRGDCDPPTHAELEDEPDLGAAYRDRVTAPIILTPEDEARLVDLLGWDDDEGPREDDPT